MSSALSNVLNFFSLFSREISRNSTRLDFGTHYLLQRGFLSRLDSVLLFAEQRELNKHKITYMIPAMHFKYELCTDCPTKACKIDWFLYPLALLDLPYIHLLAQLELQILQQKRGGTLHCKYIQFLIVSTFHCNLTVQFFAIYSRGCQRCNFELQSALNSLNLKAQLVEHVG